MIGDSKTYYPGTPLLRLGPNHAGKNHGIGSLHSWFVVCDPTIHMAAMPSMAACNQAESEMKPSEEEEAMAIRITWMRRMGLSEEEIEQSCRDGKPTSPEEERQQLRALDELATITPASSVLRARAIQY